MIKIRGELHRTHAAHPVPRSGRPGTCKHEPTDRQHCLLDHPAPSQSDADQATIAALTTVIAEAYL
jgi:hypothetical protein